MPKIIYCECGQPCGFEYGPTRDDPGFREGPGEDFINENGEWCCSKVCKGGFVDNYIRCVPRYPKSEAGAR